MLASPDILPCAHALARLHYNSLSSKETCMTAHGSGRGLPGSPWANSWCQVSSRAETEPATRQGRLKGFPHTYIFSWKK